jgi:uncharacterized protein YdhG (YjbR/CyaY superfamily)
MERPSRDPRAKRSVITKQPFVSQGRRDTLLNDEGENATVTKSKTSEVDEYIATIRAAAPGATERTDYFQMPGYSYPGFVYDGMFVWFSFKKSYIRLHVRPPVIQEHKRELADYATTKAIVSFPIGKRVPITLVKKLVKASLKKMKDKV